MHTLFLSILISIWIVAYCTSGSYSARSSSHICLLSSLSRPASSARSASEGWKFTHPPSLRTGQAARSEAVLREMFVW